MARRRSGWMAAAFAKTLKVGIVLHTQAGYVTNMYVCTPCPMLR